MFGLSLYDTTLRDGAQCEDLQLTTPDKIKIALKLDEFGLDYIEGGWPGANPVDTEFFRDIANYSVRHARIAAFGSTHHASFAAENDPTMHALVNCGAPVVTIFGKSSEKHARDALRLAPERNLGIIRDSVAYLKSKVETVFFDAEHFFDGYAANPEYSLAALRAAAEGGADALVLCETNGGRLPSEVSAVVARVGELFPNVRIGIHAHNDCELAVANSIAAVQAGATHIQGTINGVGERCGNANLCSVMPILELKLGKKCLPEGSLEHLSSLSAFVCEIGNMKPFSRQPFVGRSAFAHKGGVHVSAVNRDSTLYEHIEPSLVGNGQRILITELAGRSNIVSLAKRFGFHLDKDEPVVKGLFHELKSKASLGYDYASAEASMELLLLRKLARRGVREFFTLRQLRVIDTKNEGGDPVSEATVMVEVEGAAEHTAATGMGPVNAIDNALRKALVSFYPNVAEMQLKDFKVRVLTAKSAAQDHSFTDLDGNPTIEGANNDGGTASVVRVLIESSDGRDSWITVGVSYDIIEASWQALADSFTYKLYRDEFEMHAVE